MDQNNLHKDLVHLSKFLSQILRHRPEKIGLNLDAQGWADVAELLEKSALKGMTFDRATLQIVVDTNNKQRFSFSDDGLRIRANQGHSIEEKQKASICGSLCESNLQRIYSIG